MFQTINSGVGQSTASDRSRQAALSWAAGFGGLLVLSGLIGATMFSNGPDLSIVAWLVFVAGAVAILHQPRYGLYLIVFFGLAGDSVLAPWFPFIKDFSSVESVLFVNHSIKFSPLEVYIALTFVAWLVRGALQRNLKLHAGQLGWPALAFFAFAIFGMAYGLGTGGDTTVALWEARPIFYLVAMLILASNLLETREHVIHLLWIAMFALLLVGINGDLYYFLDLHGTLVGGGDLFAEHGTAIQINTLFIFAVGAFLYNLSSGKRLVLGLMLPIVAVTYIVAQRRAAFLSLIVALLLIVFLLYQEKRRVFWFIVPAATAMVLVYGVVYWNSGSKLALPVEAVKSVLLQNQASARDQSSNNYRILENINSSFTIHRRPLTGVGFGQQFYRIVALPDISFFIWWQYITHNSIIWIWMKMGAGGFVSMIFLVGLSILTGLQALMRVRDRDLRAAAFVATLYVVMHFVYAYVDMSWDIRSMVYMGAMMGLINGLERIAARPASSASPSRPRPLSAKLALARQPHNPL